MEKTDIRVIKTKRNIHNAFFELARKKDLHRITVKDICTLAECGRSTFYMYYPYKDALYNEICGTALDTIMDGFKALPGFNPGSWEDFAAEYLHNVLSSLYQIKKLFPIIPPESEAFSVFLRDLTDRMLEYMYQQSLQIYQMSDEKKIKVQAINRVIISGIINEAAYCYTKTDYSVEFVHDLINPLFHAYYEEIEKLLGR